MTGPTFDTDEYEYRPYSLYDDPGPCPWEEYYGVYGLDYSTTPRNENPVNENHLEICLSFSQKNRN